MNMSSVKVCYVPLTDGAFDLFSDALVRGELTSEHPASAGGLPVFVRDDGVVLTPGDIGGCDLRPDEDIYAKPYRDWRRGEEDGADSVSLGVPYRPTKFTGEKYRPGVVELFAAAAGYAVTPLP